MTFSNVADTWDLFLKYDMSSERQAMSFLKKERLTYYNWFDSVKISSLRISNFNSFNVNI